MSSVQVVTQLFRHQWIIPISFIVTFCHHSIGQIKQHPAPDTRDVQVCEAIEAGDLTTVQKMLDEGFDPNHLVVDSDDANEKKSPLAFAVENEEHQIFDLLLQRGASPNSAIKEAAGADDPYYILTLYQQGADVFEVQPVLAEYESAETITALKEAITKGKALDPNREGEALINSMIHPISKRLSSGEPENAVPTVIQILIDAGCSPNGVITETDTQGNIEETTFLVRALHAGRYLTAEELIRHGADVNQFFSYYKNPTTHHSETETALMEFSRLGRAAVVRFLLFNHANPNLKNSDGFSALTLAIEAVPYQGVVDSLLIAGADPNEKVGPEMLTPLMMAVSKRDSATVNTLLNFGADPALTDRFGRHLKDFAKAQSTVFATRTPDPQNVQQITRVLASKLVKKSDLPHRTLEPVNAIDIARSADRLSRSNGIGDRDLESEDAERGLRRICSTILEELSQRSKLNLQNAVAVYSTYFALMNYADAWATLSEDIRGGTSYIRYSISTDAFLDVIRDRKRVLAKLILRDNSIPKFDSSTRDPFAEQAKLFRKVEKRTRPSDNSAKDYTTLTQLWKIYRKSESNLARLVLSPRKQANTLITKYDRFSVDQHNLRIKESIDRLHSYQ